MTKNTNAINTNTLGDYLRVIRKRLNMSLRDVEEATDKDVSNAYLSQLENGKISKPSPHILHKLAEVFSEDYTKLMEKAGYITPNADSNFAEKHGKAATFAIDNLSSDEENELLQYLSYIRSKR